MSRFDEVETRLVQMGDTLRDLLAALGPCGDFDGKGNCRKHFATCPCPVGEADVMLAKMRETTPSHDSTGSATCEFCRYWEPCPTIVAGCEREMICSKSKDCGLGLGGQDGRAIITPAKFGCVWYQPNTGRQVRRDEGNANG